MNEKIEQILAQLRKGFPGKPIHYQSTVNIHIFRIVTPKLTHWLYVSQEFIEDNEKEIILNLFNSAYKIIDMFKMAKSSKRLLLTNDGVKEVNEDYRKQWLDR
jgi:hypothetical protein